jgi:hypothetical protein
MVTAFASHSGDPGFLPGFEAENLITIFFCIYLPFKANAVTVLYSQEALTASF